MLARMLTHRPPRLARALVAILALVAPAPAFAQRAPSARAAHPKPLAQALPPEAKGDYDAGKILFEDGDFQTARIKYQAAYDLTHDARLLWNVAVCQKNERHYARALATLARYLADGGDLLTAGDRRDAQDLSKAITPFTSAATFRVSEDGAQVWVDDALVGTTPIDQPFAVDLGPRRIRARKEGFRPYEEEVEVAGNATVTIDVVMKRQSGRLDLRVPASATVAIDGKPVGTGPSVEADLPVGGHELLVSAPGMRPYQGDLVIEDGRTRAFDLTLERAADPASEVRVAVGCNRPEPAAPEEGLAVFFDGATESAPALGTRRSAQVGRDVVAYVPYEVPPGKHTVRVGVTGCTAEETSIDASLGGHASITGMLPSTHLYFYGSPAGSPTGWRVSAGVATLSESFSSYSTFFQPPSGTLALNEPVNMTLVGPMVSGGLQGRWAEFLGDVRVLTASTGKVPLAATSTVPAGSTAASSLTIVALNLRPGARLPLFFGALSSGFTLGTGRYAFSPSNLGPGQSSGFFDIGAWAALDIKPVCDWALQGGIGYDATSFSGPATGGSGGAMTWVHLVYEPNVTCTRARAGAFQIEATPSK
jgi:hypothetical protein